MKQYLMLVWMVLLLPAISAATISGVVYDFSYEPVAHTHITINSVPEQFVISTDGSYSFELGPGTYLITATKDDEEASAQITITDDGTFRRDLILLPTFADEDELQGELDTLSGNLDTFNYRQDITAYIILLTVILALHTVYLFRRQIKRLFTKQADIKHLSEKGVDDAYAKQVISFIKKEGGRTTQKDIRKHIPLSEAKISLILAELEHDEKIKKFKKGRSNVIVLK